MEERRNAIYFHYFSWILINHSFDFHFNLTKNDLKYLSQKVFGISGKVFGSCCLPT